MLSPNYAALSLCSQYQMSKHVRFDSLWSTKCQRAGQIRSTSSGTNGQVNQKMQQAANRPDMAVHCRGPAMLSVCSTWLDVAGRSLGMT